MLCMNISYLVTLGLTALHPLHLSIQEDLFLSMASMSYTHDFKVKEKL